MQFHQSAQEMGWLAPPGLSAWADRNDLYAWFRRPVASGLPGNVSVAAENVIALLVTELPDDQRCYDTRRHQWDNASPEAEMSRHQLPRSLELTLISADETGWAHLPPAVAAAAGIRIEAFLAGHFQEKTERAGDMASLRQLMDGLKVAVVETSITVSY